MNKEELTKEIYKAFNKFHNEMSLRMRTFRLAHIVAKSADLQDDYANAESILHMMQYKDDLYKYRKVLTKKEILTLIGLNGCYTVLISVVYDSIKINTQIYDAEKSEMLLTLFSFIKLSEGFSNTLSPIMEGELL